MTVLDKIILFVWLAGMLVIGGGLGWALRHPDRAGLDRLTVSSYRAKPLAVAFVLAMVVLSWPVSVPVLRYVYRQAGGGQAGGDGS